MPKSPRLNSVGVFLVAALGPLMWAGNFVVARALHEAIEPFQLNYLRWVVAGIVLLPFTVRNWPQIAAAWASHPLQMLALGFLSVTLFNWLVYSGLHHSPASTGGAIFALSALLILFISQVWHGRRLQACEILGAVIAFSGATLMVWQDVKWAIVDTSIWGPSLLLAGSFIWAIYTVCLRRW
ncbi:DMT family transporter, partial [Marivita geojedonensis]